MFLDTTFNYLTEDDMMQDGDMGMEGDSSMDLGDDGMGGDSSGDMGMDSGGDMSGGMGASGGMGMDGTTDPASQLDPKEAMKRRRLFDDYKNLYQLVDELITTIDYINCKNFTPSERKIFFFLEEKMKENKEKLRIILIEQFTKAEYKSLLTMFIYFKMSIKNYGDIVNKFLENEKERDENL